VAQDILRERGLSPEQVCYIGDELTDLPVIRFVGLGVAVGDAAEEVRAAAAHTTGSFGGRGAVRELIETILKAKGRWDDVIQRYLS
jgi:YrbI family 3-deoxy-D-manno-octulosonate 8-phosphate phosphatase